MLSFRAAPVESSESALVLAADRIFICKGENPYHTLTGYKAQNAAASQQLFKATCSGVVDTASLEEKLNVVLNLTETVLKLLEIAQNSGSISGLLRTSEDEDKFQEVTKSFSEFCAEMDEVLMTFIHEVQSDARTLKKFVQLLKSNNICADVRLRTLMYAYNSEPRDSKHKALLFQHVVDYAASVGLLEIAVLPVLNKAVEWIDTWNVGHAQKTELCTVIASKLRAVNQKSQALTWEIKAIVYMEKDDVFTEENLQITAQTLRNAIASPNTFLFDELMQYKAIQAVKNVAPGLFELCRVLWQGNIADWDQWKSQYNASEFAEKHNLDLNELSKKLQIILVASEAAKLQGGNNCWGSLADRCVVSLSQLAENVGITLEDAQEACVSGVGRGLFVAKLDQLNKTIEIESGMFRDFGFNEWAMIKSRVDQWLQGVAHMKSMLVVPAE